MRRALLRSCEFDVGRAVSHFGYFETVLQLVERSRLEGSRTSFSAPSFSQPSTVHDPIANELEGYQMGEFIGCVLRPR
jgi:hypothetical protein